MMRIVHAGMLFAAAVSTASAQTTRTPQPASLVAGIAQFEAERLDQAKATLTPVAKAGDAEAMYYLGRIAIEQSDGDEAVRWLEQAITKNDRSSLYHQWLSSAYRAKAATANPLAQMTIASSMKREMERAVELDSANIEARVNLTQFYLGAPTAMGGGADRARAQVAAVMLRNRYQGRLLDARVAENQKDTVSAERTLRDVVAAFPDSATPAQRLVTFYVNLKRYDDAFGLVEERLRRLPNDAPALYQLGRVGAASGTRLDRAQWGLDRYLKIPHTRGTPTLAAAHWRMGMIFEAKADKKTAIAEYEAALRLDPKLAGARTSLDRLK